MKENYRKRDIEEITGLPARRVQFYTENIPVTPKENPGRGYERLYSDSNLFEFLIIKELAGLNVELSNIKWIMSFLHKMKTLDIKKYRKKDKAQYLYVFKDKISIHGEIDPKTLKRTDRITIDMKGENSALLVNLSALADKIV